MMFFTHSLSHSLTDSLASVLAPQESLQESCSQVTTLQQKERERELQRERERELEREQQLATRQLMALQRRVNDLVDQGLLRMEQSPSGVVDLQVVPVVRQGPLKSGCRQVTSWTAGFLATTENCFLCLCSRRRGRLCKRLQ